MPHIAVMLYPGRDDATKQKIAQVVHAALADELKMPKEAVSVTVAEYAPDTFVSEVNRRFEKKDLYISSDYIK